MLRNEMLQQCYNAINLLLKVSLQGSSSNAVRFNLPPRISLRAFALSTLLLTTTISVYGGDHAKLANTVGYSVDFGIADGQTALADLRSVDELKTGAVAGDAVAQNSLGYLYTFGLDVPQDYSEAAGWFARSAAKGLAAAEYNLGALYERGFGVERNLLLAVKWYRLAAE